MWLTTEVCVWNANATLKGLVVADYFQRLEWQILPISLTEKKDKLVKLGLFHVLQKFKMIGLFRFDLVPQWADTLVGNVFWEPLIR